MNQVEVKSSDVIKLILQFLKENNLLQSFETLQRQSKTSLNIVDTNQFVSSIMKEKWDEVLVILNSLMLNEEHLFNLYELIVDDLIEHDRYQAAEHLIKTFLYKNIKNLGNYRERLLRMEYIIQHPQEKALHKKVVTQHRKQETVKQCLFDVHEDVEPSRLMKLLTQAIKYQSSEGAIKPGIKLNLFEGKQKIVQQQQETIIKSIQKVVKYQEDAKINSIALSWGEQLLALGGFDGLIEIYNTIDYSYHTGLKFQEEGTALFHDHPVNLMEFNHSDEMLASADTKGLIKIWNLQNGKLLRKIQAETGVNSICWGIDPSHLAVGYHDIKLYGIRSCMVLKEYSVSAGGDFINKILISQNKIYVATNSGLVKIFNYSTQEELISTNLRQMVINILPIYSSRAGNSIDRILVLTSKKIYELNRAGEEQGRYAIEVGQLSNASCVGQYLYEFINLQDKTNKLNIVSRSTHKNVYYCSLQNEVIFCSQQRQKNLMITYDSRHHLNFWRYWLYYQKHVQVFYISLSFKPVQVAENLIDTNPKYQLRILLRRQPFQLFKYWRTFDLEIPSEPMNEETYLIEGKKCSAKRYFKINKGPQKVEQDRTINYLSTASDNQIRKTFQITYNSTTIILEDCITVHQQKQQEVVEEVVNEEKNQVKNSSTGDQNQKNKKLVLLKQSIFSSSDQANKNDKKNIVKNVVNAYLKYLKNVQEENKEIETQLNLLKEMINSKKFNNQLITSIVAQETLRCYFKHFLAAEAGEWLEKSKIKNKNSYEEALKVYEKLCDRQETQEQCKNGKPSPGQQKNSNNSLSCFRELENHELEDEIEKFK